MEKVKETIEKVREIVLQEIEKDPESFDPPDVERVRQDNAYIYRFVEDRYGKADDAAKMLSDALRWRKSFGVSELFEFHKDRNSIPTLYLRIDRHRPLPGWKEIIKRFIIFNIERAERISVQNGTGIGLVVDARGGKIYHIEIDLDFFALKSIINYYPGCLQYLAIFEIPWVLMAILKLVKSWCPSHYQEKFKFINKSNVDDFIGLENLPDFMGGHRPMLYPEECFSAPPGIEFEKTGGLPKGAIEKMNKIYDFALKDFYESEEYRARCKREEEIKTKNLLDIKKTVSGTSAVAAVAS